MLIQHTLKMSPKMSLVNKTLMSAALIGAAIAMPTSASAFNYSDSISTSVHKVKFKRADLETPEGVATVYAKLEKKAKRACAVGSNVDSQGNLVSKDVCAEDLLAQFIENAGVAPLKQYHLIKGAATKSANLMPR